MLPLLAEYLGYYRLEHSELDQFQCESCPYFWCSFSPQDNRHIDSAPMPRNCLVQVLNPWHFSGIPSVTLWQIKKRLTGHSRIVSFTSSASVRGTFNHTTCTKMLYEWLLRIENRIRVRPLVVLRECMAFQSIGSNKNQYEAVEWSASCNLKLLSDPIRSTCRLHCVKLNNAPEGDSRTPCRKSRLRNDELIWQAWRIMTSTSVD